MASELIIDKYGDLRLEVGVNCCPEPVSFLVCSKALARRSRVFRVMLYGPFAESKPAADAGEWVVRLPEDSPQAFRIVLNIIHANFDMVPVVLNAEKPDGGSWMAKYRACACLDDIALLTDKYDMVDVVRPWINSWFEEVTSYQPNPLRSHLDLLNVSTAWVFGDERWILSALDTAVLHASINGHEHGSFIEQGDESQPGNPPLEPQDITDSDVVCVPLDEHRCIPLRGPGDPDGVLDMLEMTGKFLRP
jgi:hypothetical protein